MVAKTFKGLENVLAEELKQLGAENVEPGNRMVSFVGDLAVLYRANICCRTALRILKPIYKFYAQDADELYNAVKDFAWDSYINPSQTFSIDATVFSEKFRHSRFVTYRVKDAIADYFTEKYGKRPSIRLNNADFMFDVHISDNEVILSLDSSGESLHKRGYRVAQTEAPINEVLAAGIIMLAGWHGETDFVDPMCGSGTFLIEAALIAANINPGIFRSNFAFERWPDFDHELFEEIYNDDSHERPFTNKIYGSDISPKAIDIASRNIKSASVGKYIELKAQPLQNIEEVAHEGGILVTNPPYGERIAVEDMEGLYRTLGEKLKRVFKGYKAWVIGYNTELLDSIGLKPSLKFPLYNGALECELREYVIFEGTYAEFRKEGRSVKNEEFKGERKPEYRRREFEPTFKDDKNGEKSRVNKWRREDGDGNRKESERRERKSRFHTEGKPKNALEEKLRKPYHERRREEESRRNKRMGDEERQSRRSETGDNNAGQQREQEHNEARTSRIVKFRQPQLSADKEQPIIHGRRNSWRRTDLPEENKGNENE